MAPAHLARPTPPPKPGGKPATPPRLTHALLAGQGAQRWHLELRSKNRDKLIVFVGDAYGIHDTHESMILTRVPLRQLPPHLGTPEDVLRRYNCLPPPVADSNGNVHLSEQDSVPWFEMFRSTYCENEMSQTQGIWLIPKPPP